MIPLLGKASALILPEATTVAMNVFLKTVSNDVPDGKHLVLILDRAGWHTSQCLETSSNITLMPLPPYYPELNPTEQIWKLIRERWLSNRCFKDYEDLLQSLVKAWNWFTEQPEKVSSLCSRKWAAYA